MTTKNFDTIFENGKFKTIEKKVLKKEKQKEKEKQKQKENHNKLGQIQLFDDVGHTTKEKHLLDQYQKIMQLENESKNNFNSLSFDSFLIGYYLADKHDHITNYITLKNGENIRKNLYYSLNYKGVINKFLLENQIQKAQITSYYNEMKNDFSLSLDIANAKINSNENKTLENLNNKLISENKDIQMIVKKIKKLQAIKTKTKTTYNHLKKLGLQLQAKIDLYL